nr:heavy metal translocating P-type ATPase [Chloroflexota bacterium]
MENHNHHTPEHEHHEEHGMQATTESDPEEHIIHQEHAGHEEQHHDDHIEHADHQAHGEHEDHSGHSGHGVDHSGHENMFRQRFWVSLILSIPVLLFSPSIQGWLNFQLPDFPGSEWITPFFGVVVFIYGGLPFLEMAIPEIKSRKPGMMTLISLAISVAFIYSLGAFFFSLGETFFWELVTLIVIMLLGHWLEMRSVRQASGALNELAKLMPDTAEIIRDDGSVVEISSDNLTQGDLMLVRPGASVPADGEVIEGETDLNEAMITGESLPVKKQSGDAVIAGTINGDGSLRVKVTATGEDTALAGIMRLVEQAQQSKSNTQILADKAAGWLFYIAIGIAALTAVAWTIGVGFNVEVIARVATVLVIACPHALGLAVPLVVAITTAMGAKNGILVRDRLALEQAREINTVIFDKTGTLTLGEFGVVGIATVDGWSNEDALGLAAAIEGDSEHTIARGIRRSAEVQGVNLPSVSNFEAIKGRGVKAKNNGHTIHIGGPRMLELLEISLPANLQTLMEQANQRGQSVVYLIQDGDAIAAFALADVIRPESKEAIDKLHKMGVEVAI